jgi:hypothetical protein
MRPTAELVALIEYRMSAVSIGHLALRYAMDWGSVPSMAIYFNDKQVIEGTATGFTNSAIEAAIVHSRALLEFAGLAGATSTKLREVQGNRRTDDEAIENYPGLRRVTIAEATAYYPGAPDEAEAALAYVIYLANKGLAHTTTTFTKHDEGTRLLEIAFRGVPTLIANRFYVASGIQPPAYEVQGRARAA